MDTNHDKKPEEKKVATPVAAAAVATPASAPAAKPKAVAAPATKEHAHSPAHKAEATPAKTVATAATASKPEACSTDKPDACSATGAEACATPAAAGATAASAAKPEACSATKPEACANMHDGKVVSVSGKTLVMSSHEGKHYSHIVADDAKVCCDGKTCRTEDLKPGNKIRLTTKLDDNKIVVKIETLDKQADFAQSA